MTYVRCTHLNCVGRWWIQAPHASALSRRPACRLEACCIFLMFYRGSRPKDTMRWSALWSQASGVSRYLVCVYLWRPEKAIVTQIKRSAFGRSLNPWFILLFVLFFWEYSSRFVSVSQDSRGLQNKYTLPSVFRCFQFSWERSLITGGGIGIQATAVNE